jgi:arginase family enzyme
MLDLTDFLTPVDIARLNDDEAYNDGQYGHFVDRHEQNFPDVSAAQVILIGCGESRGSGQTLDMNDAPDAIRKEFYKLHCWQEDIRIADLGNIKKGASIKDSYAALQTVIKEMLSLGKSVVVLGGSHDITLAQYQVYKSLNQAAEAVCVDAFIDLKGDSTLKKDSFLLDMLTEEPNYIRHYSHIGFQSFFVHPRLLETLDKLRFDCYRVGKVKEEIEEMEPVIRSSNFMSFDISAIKNSDAPANQQSPNGLTGEEACTLTQYAGMSNQLNSIGIYGYNPETDKEGLTAKQIAQMVWYFVEGMYKKQHESPISHSDGFKEYHLVFADMETLFLQSKTTGRWWMQIPDKKFIPCSKKDYLLATTNDIPERWLRAQERIV